MYHYLPIVLILLAGLCCRGPAELIVQEPQAFPKSWLGTWAGTLEIWSENKKVQEVAMGMEIKADTGGYFNWLTVYGEDTAQQVKKPYLLETLDAEKGQYRIDEQNTIFIESYLFGQKLISWYDVKGNLILVSHELFSVGELEFEVIAGVAEGISITGNSEDIPAVKTFQVRNYQRARLKKL